MVLKVDKKTRIHQLPNDTFIHFAYWKKEKFKALLTAYKWVVIPICNTSLAARHSTDEVACFRPYPLGDNFLGENNGRPCRVLSKLVLICLVLGSSLWVSLFEGRGLRC